MNNDNSYTKEEIISLIKTDLYNLIDDDWIKEIEITSDTLFLKEIELESIEFIMLGEKFVERFNNQQALIDWLGDKDLSQITELTVGDFADFILTSIKG